MCVHVCACIQECITLALTACASDGSLHDHILSGTGLSETGEVYRFPLLPSLKQTQIKSKLQNSLHKNSDYLFMKKTF